MSEVPLFLTRVLQHRPSEVVDLGLRTLPFPAQTDSQRPRKCVVEACDTLSQSACAVHESTPPQRARCGAGAGCSAMKYQFLTPAAKSFASASFK